MPYDENADLPEGVRNALPAAAQTVYRKAYNSAAARGLSESSCAKIAWAAVKNAGWHKPASAEGKWVKEADVDMAEITEDGLREAEWTTAYMNDLPDSAFLYIKPGGKKDAQGKTVPRGNRLFPYKDSEGAIDLAHLRNAISRIPQASISNAIKARLMARARRLLKAEGGSPAESNRLRESDAIREATMVPTEPNEEGVSSGSVLIAAGTNRTGRRHYTPEFLKQHLARFDGAFCNVDHPRRSDERDRPEGTLSTLAAVVENPRYDEAQNAVLGDVRYLDTAAGVDMRAAFSNPTVRENAGLSIFSTERCRSRRQKIGESTVDVPVELLGDGKFCVDFVTRPTAGGRVTEIREEDEPMTEIADLTLEELMDANPALVATISTAAVEAAQAEAKVAADKAAEEAANLEEQKVELEAGVPSESDRLTATEKELADVKAQLRRAEAHTILVGKLAEADLIPQAHALVETDFAGVECTDAEKFGAEVDARIGQVQEVMKEAALAQRVRVPGGVAETDAKPIDVGKRIREAHGIKDPDAGADK